MGWRFRRSVRLLPGVRLNLGSKSASVRFGPRGAGYTVSSTGRETMGVGIPGTGLYNTQQLRAADPLQVAPRSGWGTFWSVTGDILMWLGAALVIVLTLGVSLYFSGGRRRRR